MTYDAALRRAVASEAIQLANIRGSVPESFVRATADDLGCAQSTVWRWLRSANGSTPVSNGQPSAGYLPKLSDEHIEVVFQFFGDVAKAKRALDKVDPDIAAMSERTFRRRWHDVHPSVRAMARDGAKGLLAAQLRMVHDCDHRNDMWHIDSMECPQWVLPSGTTSDWQKPWMITVIDDATRRIMSQGITMGHPSSDDVVVVLADAMRMKPLSKPGAQAGGVPKILHSDNGSEFKNRVVKQGVKRLGIERTFTLPYSSHQNGKVERVQRTIQDELFKKLPGYSQGPESLSRKDPFGMESRMIGEEELVARVFDWVDEYNSTRPHSSLGGRTPNQAWCEDSTPLKEVDPEAIRLSLLVEGRAYKVHQRGVHFRNVYYTAPELGAAGLVGSRIQVRYMPHDPSFIEVFFEGEWVCTAFPHVNLTDSQREEIKRQVRTQYVDARTRQRHAAEQRRKAAAEDPDHVIVTEPMGPPVGDMIADEDALLALVGDLDHDPESESDAGTADEPIPDAEPTSSEIVPTDDAALHAVIDKEEAS